MCLPFAQQLAFKHNIFPFEFLVYLLGAGDYASTISFMCLLGIRITCDDVWNRYTPGSDLTQAGFLL
jgi:hypothetical protein